MKKIFITFLLFIFSVLFVNSVNAYGFGFSKNNNHKQPYIGKYEEVIAGTDSYYVGSKDERNVYFTFDAGYDNGVLSKILDVLKEKNVQSTFFVTGDFLERESDLVLRIFNEGHIVGNHTYDHKNITKLNKEELKNQITKVEEKYKEITGSEMLYYFRPPAGEFDKNSLMNVKNLGYKTFFWSIAYKDWETNKQHGEKYAIDSVINNLHNGAIILMHTVSEDNLKALPTIIDYVRNEGYAIKNLTEFK